MNPLNYRVSLPSGVLTLTMAKNSAPLFEYVDIGARQNPKRGFLFVSKVLGRHIPVEPHKVQANHEQIAKKLGDLEGPVIFVGLAETAVGLGQGVFEAWKREHPTIPAGFVHSTRHLVPGMAVCAKFEESHSHATSHFIHTPTTDLALFLDAKSLVIVDDEQSTGATAVALAIAIKNGLAPKLRISVITSICDWVSETNRLKAKRTLDSAQMAISWVSIVTGNWNFEPNPLFSCALPSLTEAPPLFSSVANNTGRLGLVASLQDNVDISTKLIRLADEIALKSNNQPILVLGSGECVHYPLILASILESRGCPVLFQAISRSPILIGGAFTRSMPVPSPMGCNTPFYLHNGDPSKFFTVVCLETEDAAKKWVAPFKCEKVWLSTTPA